MKIPEIIQDLSWFISELIYGLIPDVYGIFEFFAKEEFFTLTELKNLWNNLYIVMSVLVLFAIGIKLISAIVNPEALDGKDTPKKKSARSAFIDAIVAVFLIILVPMGFSVLNTLQKEMIDSKFIQKYIFGITFTDESNTSVGQILAYQTLSSFLYPCEEGSTNCDHERGVQQMNAISWEIDHMFIHISNEDLVSDGINDGGVHTNTLKYHTLLAPIAGGMVLYQVILMALDMALRTVKIALLELMLPIILGAFIFNREILGRWVKEFISTYLSAFLKLMAVTMMVLGLSRINPMFDKFAADSEMVNSQVSLGLLRLILVMGILRLVKEVPNLINKIFGTNIQLQGGIRGRLGQMAGVGNLAQRAWDTLRTHPIQTARRTIAAPLSAVGSFASTRIAAGRSAAAKFRAGDTRGGVGAILGGHFSSFTAAGRGLRNGWRNGNLQSIGGEYRHFEDTHPTNSTFGGTLLDTVSTRAGFGTAQQRFEERSRYVTHNGQRMTVDQLNNMRTENDVILQRRNAIRDACLDAVTSDDSNISLNVAGIGSGSYQQLTNALNGMRNSAPKQRTGESDVAYQARVQAFEQRMMVLEQALITERTNARDALMEYATTHGGSLAGAVDGAYTVTDPNGTVRTVNLSSVDASGDLRIQGRNIGITQTNYSSLAAMGVGAVNSYANLTNVATTAQNNVNAIDITAQTHQQEVYQAQNSEEGLARQANANAANARNNHGNGGGNAGGNGGGH